MERILLLIKLLLATTIVLLQSCNEMTENKTTENKMASNETLKPPTTSVSLPKADTTTIAAPKHQEPKTTTIVKTNKQGNKPQIKPKPTKQAVMGNDLVVIKALYTRCSVAMCYRYSIGIGIKHPNTELKFAYSNGYRHYIGDKDDEGQPTSFRQRSEVELKLSIPFTKEEMQSQYSGKLSWILAIAPPPIPYSGTMLIEYKLNGKTKYQNIPSNLFKEDRTTRPSKEC